MTRDRKEEVSLYCVIIKRKNNNNMLRSSVCVVNIVDLFFFIFSMDDENWSPLIVAHDNFYIRETCFSRG